MEVDNSSCGMAKVGFSDADAPSSVFPSIRSLSPTKPIQTWYFSLEIPLPSQQSPPHGPQPTQPHGQRTPPHIQIYCTIIMIKSRRTVRSMHHFDITKKYSYQLICMGQ
eukprot:495056_1